MDRRLFTLSALSAAVTALSGCGGGDDSNAVAPAPAPAPGPSAPVEAPAEAPAQAPAEAPAAPPAPQLASATTLAVATTFLQTRAAADNDSEAAPGQANYWDLTQDLGISDGKNDQFDDAMRLFVAPAGGLSIQFPGDQTYAELTAYGPELGVADGVKVVTFGTNVATLHPVKGARLQQTLDLTAATGAVSLNWSENTNLSTNNYPDEPYSYQVVIRGTDGALLSTIFREAQNGTSGTAGTGNLTPFIGQRVVLAFELISANANPVEISAVSVTDGVGTQFVTNGNFASSAGWTVPALSVVQNVHSGIRTIGGVDVRRMFFTQPDALWARYSDSFTNNGAAPVTITVTYRSNLGSDGSGIIYDTPGANGRAITTWDSDGSDRDVGFVYGNGATVAYTSATALNAGDGDDNIDVSYTLTIPAGATRTLINFVLMSGIDTGQAATAVSARATEVDNAAADIANNFRSKVAYQRGMLQLHLDTAANF